MVESRFILRSGIGLEFSGKSEVLPGELTKEDIYSYFEVANLLYIYQREPQGVEKRVDFAAIEKLYAEDAVGVDAKVRAALRRARDEMLKQVEAAARDGRISPLYAATLKIETGAVVKILQEHLVSVWRKSRDLAMRELPGKVKEKLEPLKTYATGFSPQLALDYFASRALVLKGIIDDALLNAAKLRLMQYVKGNQTLNEMIFSLRAVFEPWVGDPTKIQPSGQTGIGFPPGEKAPENILMAYRLENIIRTETTDAMTQGRLAVADATDGYVNGYEFSALLDGRETDWCQEADGLFIRASDPRLPLLTPPLWFQCRSVLVFITTDDLPVDWSSDAEIDAAIGLIPEGFNKGQKKYEVELK